MIFIIIIYYNMNPTDFHNCWPDFQVEFSVTTYNALLDVCARSGEISRAEPLLKEMAVQGKKKWVCPGFV